MSEISIDYALIAGGGGGGCCASPISNPAGGGAGSVLIHQGHTVSTNTEYCVVIGAGGAQNTSGSPSKFGDFADISGGGNTFLCPNCCHCSHAAFGGQGGSGGSGRYICNSDKPTGGLVGVDNKIPEGATYHANIGLGNGQCGQGCASGGAGDILRSREPYGSGGTGVRINLDGRNFYYGGGGGSSRQSATGGLGGGGSCNTDAQFNCGCIMSCTGCNAFRSGAPHTGGGGASRAESMTCAQFGLHAGGSGLLMIRYANTVTANLQSGATTFNSCGEELLGNKKVLRIITSGTITFTC